jgi:hypothetical protein
MFLKNNKGLFSVAAPGSEISSQFLKELIDLKDLLMLQNQQFLNIKLT